MLWKELYEFAAKPIALAVLVAMSLLVILVAGQLNVAKPQTKIYLYTKGVPTVEVAKAKSVLSALDGIAVLEQDLDSADLDGTRMGDVALAVGKRGGEWIVYHRFPTLQHEAEAAWLVGLISTSLRSGESVISMAGSATAGGSLGLSARLSALPRRPEGAFVPRTIALIVVFLPFVLAARSYTREIVNQTWSTLLVSRNGGWASVILAKLIACSWISLVVFLFLLLAVTSIFDIWPKAGLLSQLGVQYLAIWTSACLGLATAVIARSQSQAYVSIAMYFLVLVLLGGVLFPLASSSLAVQVAALAIPLSYSGKLLENWMFFGSAPSVGELGVTVLTVQAILTSLLLTGIVRFARYRL